MNQPSVTQFNQGAAPTNESKLLTLSNMQTNQSNAMIFRWLFPSETPFILSKCASLTIQGTPSILSFSGCRAQPAGFWSMRKIFILNAHVMGWNDAAGEPKPFKESPNRIFARSLLHGAGLESYFYGSLFSNLGYHLSKSYGISFSSAKSLLKKDPDDTSSARMADRQYFRRFVLRILFL